MLAWGMGGEPNADIADKGGGGVMEMLTLLTRGGWGVIEILTLDDGGGGGGVKKGQN